METLDLLRQIGLRHVVMGDVGLDLMEHKRLAMANAGGNRNPLVNALTRLRLICHKQHFMPLPWFDKPFLG
jgi:hypothetical protein